MDSADRMNSADHMSAGYMTAGLVSYRPAADFPCLDRSAAYLPGLDCSAAYLPGLDLLQEPFPPHLQRHQLLRTPLADRPNPLDGLHYSLP